MGQMLTCFTIQHVTSEQHAFIIALGQVPGRRWGKSPADAFRIINHYCALQNDAFRAHEIEWPYNINFICLEVRRMFTRISAQSMRKQVQTPV